MLTKQNGFTLPVQFNRPFNRDFIFTCIALLTALLIIYSNSFQGDWHFDDFANIVENPHVQLKSFSSSDLNKCISGIKKDGLSRPLSYLSFAMNYRISGMDVLSFHLVNFAIHYLSSIFLFLLILNTLKLPRLKDEFAGIAYPVALLSVFFWALNPVHVTSVSYIVQRMTSMAGMFYILSMYLYLKGRTSEKAGQAILFFVACFLSAMAAFLSKENAILLPASIALYDLLFIQTATKTNIKRLFKILILPALLVIIIGYLYSGGFSNALSGYHIRDFSLTDRILTQPRVLIFYLSLLFYPIGSRLTLLYDIEVSRSLLQPWTTIPAILLIVLSIVLALFLARKRPLISFCILFYFLNHIIESSILPLEMIYEHRNYIPSMFLFVPIANLAVWVIDYFSYRRVIQFLVCASVVVLLAGLGDATYRRNDIVSDDFKLWFDNIEKSPGLSRPHSNLGVYLTKLGEDDKAIIEYQKALSLNNFGSSQARSIHLHNMGIYYYKKRDYDKAMPFFEESRKNLSRYIPNYPYIARLLLLSGQTQQAKSLIKDKLEKYPSNLALMETYILLLIKGGNFNEAETALRVLLQKDISHAFARVCLAEIERQNGNDSAAAFFWSLYQTSMPEDPYAAVALIEIYYRLNDRRSLDDQISRLICLEGRTPLKTFLRELFLDKQILIYAPDESEILKIIQKRLAKIE